MVLKTRNARRFRFRERNKPNLEKSSLKYNTMKTLLSFILYYIGHFISVVMRCDLFAFMYPAYKKIMILSSDLDIHDKVWHTHNK